MKKTITALLLTSSFSVSSITLSEVRTDEDIKLLTSIVCAEMSETQNGQNYERVQILKGYGFRGDKASSLNKSIVYMTSMLGEFDKQCKRDVYISILINLPNKKEKSRESGVIDLSGTDRG